MSTNSRYYDKNIVKDVRKQLLEMLTTDTKEGPELSPQLEYKVQSHENYACEPNAGRMQSSRYRYVMNKLLCMENLHSLQDEQSKHIQYYGSIMLYKIMYAKLGLFAYAFVHQ